MPKVLNMSCGPGDGSAIRVDRFTRWGNPFLIGTHGDRDEVIAKYAEWIQEKPYLLERLDNLRGRDLACWCAPEACHADILLKLANE